MNSTFLMLEAVIRAVIMFVMIFLFTTKSVSSSGVIEIVVTKLHNPSNVLSNGSCCGNPEISSEAAAGCQSCSPRLEVCLKQYQNNLDAINSDFTNCIYGHSASEDLLLDDISSINEKLLLVPFSFEWPGSATIILQLKDARSHGGVLLEDVSGEYVILRTEKALELRPNEDPARVSYSAEGHGGHDAHDGHWAGDVYFEATVAVRCDQHYYGAGCSRYCRISDSADAHYSCGTDGLKICSSGWTGAECEIPVCNSPCVHGSCVAPNTCKCEHGWKGDLCHECIPFPGCKHGYCNKPNECLCNTRWGGPLCDKDRDYCYHRSPCRNGGFCSPTEPNNYTCSCLAGFAGRDCEIALGPCANVVCQNFGTCVETENSFQCNCGPMHAGSHCEYRVSDEPFRPCYDMETKNHYMHDTHWESMHCRNCWCYDGTIKCSEFRCSHRNCLEDTEDGTAPCPAEQTCKTIQEPICLKPPCHTYGECRPWNLIEQQKAINQCVSKPERCANFYATLSLVLLPSATTLESVCFHIELLLWAKNITNAVVNCSLVMNNVTLVMVRATVVSNATLQANGLVDVLETMLRSNLTFSPILRAVVNAERNKALLNRAKTQELGMGISGEGKLLQASLIALLAVTCFIIIFIISFSYWLRQRRKLFEKSEALKSSAVSVPLRDAFQKDFSKPQPSVHMIQNNLRAESLHIDKISKPICLRALNVASDVVSVHATTKQSNLWSSAGDVQKERVDVQNLQYALPTNPGALTKKENDAKQAIIVTEDNNLLSPVFSVVDQKGDIQLVATV